MERETILELVGLAEAYELQDELEDTVSDYYASEAAGVNQEGTEQQILLLAGVYGEQWLRDMLARKWRGYRG